MSKQYWSNIHGELKRIFVAKYKKIVVKQVVQFIYVLQYFLSYIL